MRFMTFSALFAGGADLTGANKAERVNAGYILSQALTQKAPEIFETVVTAKTFAEKMDLIHTQKSQGREGEIWFDTRLAYQPGKPKHDVFVRTKYALGTDTYIITDVFPTTAEGHAIGAFAIVDTNGNDVGSVGTGYTREEQREILARHQANLGQVRVLVNAQNKTEYGKLFHARFVGFPQE
jgi:ATP-dependent DNA ligase